MMKMRKLNWVLAMLMALILIMSVLLLAGCANNTGSAPKPGDAMNAVAAVASTVPGLAQQLNSVYAYLVQQKAVPDHIEAATKALAALDAIAPMVQQAAQQEAQTLTGDNINWVQFVVQGALMVAQAMGYILPLVV